MRPANPQGAVPSPDPSLLICSRIRDGLRLRVRVHPRSSRDRVSGPHGDALKISVTAPPVDGAANDAVIDALADWLGVSRRMVSVVQGASGRNKVIEVRTDAPDELLGRIRLRLQREGGRSSR